MCGIAGIVRIDGTEVDPDVLTSMAETLAHRGPDDRGQVVLGPVGLAHRRLSVIDLDGSPQPMRSADGRFTLAFNGEILNHAELRRRHRLTVHSGGDTEVLLALLSRYGPDVLVELRGQFAFALHDAEDDSVLLARDRLGILPLHHVRHGGCLAFASEPKAFVPLTGPPVVDPQGVADFLVQRAVPAPATILAGIGKVVPGTWMRLHVDGRVEQRQWWSLATQRPPGTHDPDGAGDELERLLSMAVAENLIADVAVGAYLSGGVDSTVVVALARRAAPETRLATFSAGFPGSADDERPAARAVAEILGTDHHEVTVTPSSFLDELGRLSWFRDAPVSETSDVAVAALARAAAGEVTVVLSGEGSDELFAGYPKYRWATTVANLCRLPVGARRPVARAARRHLAPHDDRISTVLRVLEADGAAEALRSWFAPFTVAEAAELTGRSPRPVFVPGAAHLDTVDRLGRLDLASWLPDNLLERGDRMTMASSVELRPPFLDPRVVEFALSLPASIKLRHGVPKWPVRALARRLVGAETAQRPKIGFRVPVAEWMRGPWRNELRARLTAPDSPLAGLLDRRIVERLLAEHLDGRADRAKQLWPLLSLAVWIDRQTPGRA
jgi:asparagine synthase (glutamine-hydrolysing)